MVEKKKLKKRWQIKDLRSAKAEILFSAIMEIQLSMGYSPNGVMFCT